MKNCNSTEDHSSYLIHSRDTQGVRGKSLPFCLQQGTMPCCVTVSCMHACKDCGLIMAGHAAAYGPSWGATVCVCVCAQRVHVLCVACAHGKTTTAADACVAPRQGTSARRRRGPCLRACVTRARPAGRQGEAQAGPWVLGGCMLAGRGRGPRARGRPPWPAASALYSMANADCRELKERHTTTTRQQAKMRVCPSKVPYTAAAACLLFHEEKSRRSSSHGVIGFQQAAGARAHTHRGTTVRVAAAAQHVAWTSVAGLALFLSGKENEWSVVVWRVNKGSLGRGMFGSKLSNPAQARGKVLASCKGRHRGDGGGSKQEKGPPAAWCFVNR